MPEPTNIARAVLNSSNGRWYKYEREGDRLKALDPDGLILRPAGSGVNAIDVYRVTDERGDFKSMVATAEEPATLKVWARDADTDNLTLVEEVSCTSFSGNRCRFVLAADYSAYGNRAARLDFLDGTAGTITASLDSVRLHELSKDPATFQIRPTCYRILSAIVENLDDKRVTFESSDPSVCRIERGSLSNSDFKVADVPQQTDQYCILVGEGKGSCTVTCRSVADPSLEDVVEVTVETHPDDEPRVIGGDIAQELTDLLSGVRVGVDLSTIRESAAYQNNTVLLERREIVVPGDIDDLFDLTLAYAGTVPKSNWPSGYTGQETSFWCVICVGSDRWALGTAGQAYVFPGTAKATHEGMIAYDLGYGSCLAINTEEVGPDKTEALNSSARFFVRGGDTIMVGFAVCNTTVNIATPSWPSGHYEVEFNATSVTLIPRNDGGGE